MIYQTIGKNIKRFRQQRGMTQSELADHLFVSPQMVSRYENNSAAPDIAMLAKISTVFQVSLDVLCGLDNTSKDKCINYLLKKYSEKTYGSFAALNEKYENFLIESSEVIHDDRVMKIQLSLLENLHDNTQIRVIRTFMFQYQKIHILLGAKIITLRTFRLLIQQNSRGIFESLVISVSVCVVCFITETPFKILKPNNPKRCFFSTFSSPR